MSMAEAYMMLDDVNDTCKLVNGEDEVMLPRWAVDLLRELYDPHMSGLRRLRSELRLADCATSNYRNLYEQVLHENEMLANHNQRLRSLVAMLWAHAVGAKRLTFADKVLARKEIYDMGVDVDWRLPDVRNK